MYIVLLSTSTSSSIANNIIAIQDVEMATKMDEFEMELLSSRPAGKYRMDL